MKTIAIAFFLISSTAFSSESAAQVRSREHVGAPPNAVSRGQSDWGGISDSPTDTTKKEAKRIRTRAESMGGAPNARGGTGTGTGAGSTVGHGTGRGVPTARATSGEDDE